MPEASCSGGTIIGYAQDITAQKEYNDVLKKFSDKKNAILNILSHDLAGPLANIQVLSAMLADDAKAYIDHAKMQQATFFTDDWQAYKQVIPAEKHRASGRKKDTNHTERFFCTLRQRCSRLVRK